MSYGSHGYDDDDQGHGHGYEHDDDHGRDGDDDDSGSFDFDQPDFFKFDLDNLNLKKLGKITDYDVSHSHLSVTFGNQWTFEVDGSGLDYTMKKGLPVVTGGTIDSFTIDGPGKADFSISDLDLSAKALYNAIVNFQGAKLVSLLLGGDETFSGSGFGDFIFGGAGNDTIHGNDGRDQLLGGAGNDVIDGGTGGDLLTGGAGADTFAFAPHSGMDLITDFNTDADTLDLTAFGFQGSVEDFLAWNVGSEHGHGRCDGGFGGDVVINLGHGDMIKLAGVTRDELSADNILL